MVCAIACWKYEVACHLLGQKPLSELCWNGCRDDESQSCSHDCTAIAWLQIPSSRGGRGSSSEADCLLAAAQSEGICIYSMHRCDLFICAWLVAGVIRSLPCSHDCTAIAWLGIAASSDTRGSSSEAECLLSAAQSDRIFSSSLHGPSRITPRICKQHSDRCGLSLRCCRSLACQQRL